MTIIKKTFSPKINFVLTLFIAMLVLFAYWPSLANRYIENWDDDIYVLKNSLITDFSLWKNWFATFLLGNYHPLTVFSLANR